jgi:hypothetical protein
MGLASPSCQPVIVRTQLRRAESLSAEIIEAIIIKTREAITMWNVVVEICQQNEALGILGSIFRRNNWDFSIEYQGITLITALQDDLNLKVYLPFPGDITSVFVTEHFDKRRGAASDNMLVAGASYEVHGSLVKGKIVQGVRPNLRGREYETSPGQVLYRAPKTLRIEPGIRYTVCCGGVFNLYFEVDADHNVTFQYEVKDKDVEPWGDISAPQPFDKEKIMFVGRSDSRRRTNVVSVDHPRISKEQSAIKVIEMPAGIFLRVSDDGSFNGTSVI